MLLVGPFAPVVILYSIQNYNAEGKLALWQW
jgi:hypothetical protein